MCSALGGYIWFGNFLLCVTHGLCIRSCFMSNTQSVCVGYFKVRERVVFQQLMGCQMFDFLLFQPFRFPQNCHLLERVSSQWVPEILCTTAVLLRKQQSFQSVQVTLESALMPQKGRKARTALAWVALLVLPWFHFLFHFDGFPFHPVASSQRLFAPLPPSLGCSPSCSHSLAHLCPQRSGCCHCTCLRPSVTSPGLQPAWPSSCHPAAQLSTSEPSGPDLHSQLPPRDKCRSLCWCSQHGVGERGRGKAAASCASQLRALVRVGGIWHSASTILNELAYSLYRHPSLPNHSFWCAAHFCLSSNDMTRAAM